MRNNLLRRNVLLDGDRLNAICIMGPTGTGKSSLALALANTYPVEIVSVDSIQVYRDLNVGSAKPSRIDKRKIPHHLVDICELDEVYSAARFCADAEKVCAEIFSRGFVPLFVGGTGLYFRSFLNGLSELPTGSPTLRAQLQSEVNQFGLEKLHKKLRIVDPLSASRIHPHDKQRIMRALEVPVLSGKTMSSFFEKPLKKNNIVKPIKFVLVDENRNRLRERLRTRFLGMLKGGLINEVLNLKLLKYLKEPPSGIKSVGYIEVWRYLENQLKYDEMVSSALVATWQLAKRQTTWFKRESRAIRLKRSDQNTFLDTMKEEIEKANIF